MKGSRIQLIQSCPNSITSRNFLKKNIQMVFGFILISSSLVEGDSCWAIRTIGLCKAPWTLADTMEEVNDLGKALDASFMQVYRSASFMVDQLGKESLSSEFGYC